MVKSAILFASKKNDVFILDIPTSIAEAQFNSFYPPPDRNVKLLSCEALTEPYQSTEPGSSAAAANIHNHDGDDELHRGYINTIEEAYADLVIEDSAEVFQKESWCHERAIFQAQPLPVSKEIADKRKWFDGPRYMPNTEYINLCTAPGPPTEEELLVILHRHSGSNIEWKADESELIPHSRHQSLGTAPYLCFNNHWLTGNEWIKVRAELPQPQKSFAFRVPSQSIVVMGKCEQLDDFEKLVRDYRKTERASRFHVILLDPPWPNRSVLRKLPYYVTSDPQAVRNLIVGMCLNTHIMPEGFVAIWITNKPAIRKMVLGELGIFAKMGFKLVEEWIWVKVTTAGKPVTPLEGLWRKPYEVLLIGQAPNMHGLHPNPHRELRRRVIFAVPDLHSRKPCMKELIERLLLRRNDDYMGLEVFGRYLMANWMSWGDEVLKYNWEGYWTTTDEETT